MIRKPVILIGNDDIECAGGILRILLRIDFHNSVLRFENPGGILDLLVPPRRKGKEPLPKASYFLLPEIRGLTAN